MWLPMISINEKVWCVVRLTIQMCVYDDDPNEVDGMKEKEELRVIVSEER